MWLVLAHAFEVLLLLAVPIWVAKRIARASAGQAKQSNWKGIFGAGVLTFILAEVLRMGLSHAEGYAIGSGWVDLDLRGPNGPLITAALAGVSTALTDQLARLFAFSRWIDGRRSRIGALHGIGQGGAQAMLSGLLVLWMAGIAIVLEGHTMSEVQSMGFEGRTAIRVGARVYAWWASSPVDALTSGAGELAIVALHVGLSVTVLRAVRTRGWRWLWFALGAQAVLITLVTWIAATSSGWATLGVQVGVALAGFAMVRLAAPGLDGAFRAQSDGDGASGDDASDGASDDDASDGDASDGASDASGDAARSDK